MSTVMPKLIKAAPEAVLQGLIHLCAQQPMAKVEADGTFGLEVVATPKYRKDNMSLVVYYRAANNRVMQYDVATLPLRGSYGVQPSSKIVEKFMRQNNWRSLQDPNAPLDPRTGQPYAVRMGRREDLVWRAPSEELCASCPHVLTCKVKGI